MTNPTWSVTSPLTTPRRFHTATLLTDGNVLVTGGANAQSAFLSSAELYNPLTGSWTPTGSLNVGRVEHTATLLPDGTVLVAGGRSDSGRLNAAELFDPAKGEWRVTGNLLEARGSHTSTLLRTGLVLVAGGTDNGTFPDRLASAELYDPGTGAWKSTGSLTLNNGRTSHTATLLGDGRVLVVGGQTFGPFMADGAELYDSTREEWTATANPSTVRVDHTATLLRTGRVLVVGGVRSNAVAAELDSAELFDPETLSFVETGRLRSARTRHAAVRLSSGHVLVGGGFKDIAKDDITIPSTLSSAELYDPKSGEWTTTVDMNTGRGQPESALLKDGVVLVAGGARKDLTGSVPLNDAELFAALRS